MSEHVLAFAIFTLVLLVGCGDGGSSGHTDTDPTPTATFAATPSPAATPNQSISRAWAVGGVPTFSDDTLAVISRSDDGGATWSVVDEKAAPLNAVSFASRQDGWVVGDAGILHSADGGDTWTVQRSLFFEGENLRDVAVTSPLAGVVVGSQTTGIVPSVRSLPIVLRTSDGGTTWARVTLPGTLPQDRASDLADVCLLENGRGFALGSNPGGEAAIVTSDGGATWTDVTPAVFADGVGPFAAIACVPGGGFWAVGASVVHSDDGMTWTDRTAPVRVALPSGELLAVHFNDTRSGWLTASVIESNDALRPVILHTTDGGATWQLEPLPLSEPTAERLTMLATIAFIGDHGIALGQDTVIADDIRNPLGLFTDDGGAVWHRATFASPIGLIFDFSVVP